MKDNRLVEMRVFRAVAEAGGFTAAAQLLGVSQPFVSQTLTALERRLGVQLLHRSTRTQRLTAEGQAFLAACRRVMEEIDLAEAEVASPEPAGELRVTVPRAFGSDQIVPRLPQFMATYPAISVQVQLSDSVTNLLEENFDVAIRMGRLQDSSLMSRRLCALQRIVVASPGYIDRHGPPVTPQGLERHNCLMWMPPAEHLNRWPFMINGQRQDLAVKGSFRSSDGTALFQMCVAGVGVMRLAEHLALPALRSGQLVPLLADYQAADDTAIHAVFLPERRLVPRVRAFVDYFTQAFSAPPWAA
ncbi:LysR family transcriptional regulator [Azohydromonas caseinilytica]|uniref:LysR family transcriptional regulator n=1 Tax=Azohydromonas caseinilytica TaxID=2728836 RepID=A0A848FN18_9BURK|nr:LysR family transcriptional regulator [Azohydromonas caseinilytica]NML19111.1 LysR family transcriptional regulator [Azohydromonas caseinilytica]